MGQASSSATRASASLRAVSSARREGGFEGVAEPHKSVDLGDDALCSARGGSKTGMEFILAWFIFG